MTPPRLVPSISIIQPRPAVATRFTALHTRDQADGKAAARGRGPATGFKPTGQWAMDDAAVGCTRTLLIMLGPGVVRCTVEGIQINAGPELAR